MEKQTIRELAKNLYAEKTLEEVKTHLADYRPKSYVEELAESCNKKELCLLLAEFIKFELEL